jgi:hypothetical protein
MANTKKIDVALAAKMAQVEFDYVDDKASAFLMFNDMLELFRNVHPDGSLEQGQMYLVGDSFVATTSVKVGEIYLAKDIVGVASPDDMKAKVETTPMLALRRSRAAALIAAGFGLPFEIREAKKAEYEKENGLKVKEKQPELKEETDNAEKSNVVESPKATDETKEVPVEEQSEEKPKKRRGRPRKQPVPVEQEQPEEVVEAEEQSIEVETVEAEKEVRVKEKTDEVALDASSEEVSLFDVKEDKEESTEEQAAVTETNDVQEDAEAEDVQSGEENSVVDESSDLLTNMDAGQAETVQIDFIEESNEDVPVSEVKAILPEQPESMELLPEKSPKEIMAEVGKTLPEYVDVSISYEVAKAKVSAVVRRPSTDVTYGQMLATLKAVKDGSESEFANSFTCIIRWLLNQAYLGQSPYKERKADVDAALQLYVNNIELFDELFVRYKAEA